MKNKEDIKDEAEPKATDDTKQQSSGESDEGIHVTEEYQKKAHELISGATKHQVSHVRNRLNDREDELRKEEMSKEKSAKPSKSPETYEADSSY